MITCTWFGGPYDGKQLAVEGHLVRMAIHRKPMARPLAYDDPTSLLPTFEYLDFTPVIVDGEGILVWREP